MRAALSHKDPLIYGTDDRAFVSASNGSPELHVAASQGVAALIGEEHLEPSNGGWRLTAPNLATVDGLCADERFAQAPSAAFCTGFLVQPSQVLTAGHCIVDKALCRDGFKIVFGYVDGALTLAEAQVFDCVKVLQWRSDPWLDLPSQDYALLEIDRPAMNPLRPLPTEVGASVSAGDTLSVIGAGQGIPLTLDRAGRAVTNSDPVAGYFELAADLFHGASGGPVLNRAGRVVGIVSGGQGDYEYDAQSACFRARVTESPSAFERATLLPAVVGAAPDKLPRGYADATNCSIRSGAQPNGAGTIAGMTLALLALIGARCKGWQLPLQRSQATRPRATPQRRGVPSG